jgi:hypothetical protein
MVLVASSLFLLDCYGAPTKRIGGPYVLRQFALHRYHIERTGRLDPSGGGVLKGTVTKIGWNERYILVWRAGMSDRDPSGWMIIDLQEEAIDGPLSDRTLAEKREANAELRSVEIAPVEEAWRKL